MKSAYVGVLSIIELKNARRNIETSVPYLWFVLYLMQMEVTLAV